MDANGHLNNLALEALHESARAEFNARIFPGIYQPEARTVRLVTATNVVHFLSEVHWPVTIHTGLGIGRIGRTSFVSSTALFVGENCVGLCDTVLVLLGDDGPTPIPPNRLESNWGRTCFADPTTVRRRPHPAPNPGSPDPRAPRPRRRCTAARRGCG